ncbi:2-hydroxyacid dehydrogenase [Pseudacidovorax intermedius]|uniref:2-hydroxyacid dehydrogenase n=1 Tax=Pseudacidovorax intermedius TaxID=433924 RepID=A0A147H3H9_9BURK|nr:2-hydroxyacid dehydrogenase [Pseudacidovorax intermedius]KTT24538.1 2-hydroxyacid dehydrogenase [Pseudacidovorax intermedius]
MSAKIPLLVLNQQTPEHLQQIGAVYDLVYAPTPAERAAAVAGRGRDIRAVLTIGTLGLTPDEIAAMPALELVCCMGVGYEGLPMDVLRARGIATANGAGTNDSTVADHAFGLILAIVRRIPERDRLCREGVWRDVLTMPPQLEGRRLGIFGMGAIGAKLARRAAGFDMPVGYHNRKPVEGSPHRYFDDLAELARWCDVLVCAAPGGAATRHKVNAAVLEALGPQGYLVNVGRGSLVDTEALAAALRSETIAGAALDVYESEPKRPEPLVGLANIVLSPHMAGWSPEAVQRSVDRFMANAEGHFAGRGVVSPI